MEVKTNGGLGIRDPDLMNKEMGSNLVWRLIYGEKDLWKEVIEKKCIKKTRSKCLDSSWDGKGTPYRVSAKNLLA